MAGLVMTLAGTVLAQSPSPQQRRAPVLRSSRIFSNEQTQNPNEKQSPEVDEGSVLRVSTSLITVPAVVMDRNGRYIGNLRNWQPWLAAATPGLLYMAVSLAAFGWLVLRR